VEALEELQCQENHHHVIGVWDNVGRKRPELYLILALGLVQCLNLRHRVDEASRSTWYSSAASVSKENISNL